MLLSVGRMGRRESVASGFMKKHAGLMAMWHRYDESVLLRSLKASN